MRLLLVNGPNLNLLGVREPETYGRTTLPELVVGLKQLAAELGASLNDFQSNHEGELIEALHTARTEADGVIINPAGYGHTSVALRDALITVDQPAIEIHISNLARREAFRHQTLISDIVVGTIAGFGVYGYHLAVRALVHHLSTASH